ncbi:MAG: class I SAM-dependent DNA methyltransferase [Deltaproteobacteria bacterium]|nr:class I SAM-dependent DNA methyltransferase [Deltaproteobacteria bacterium]
MARNQKSTQPATTAQRLSSIVKACRDIMRKDKGLNGDLDRLPMLTWIMFLKFLDDMEQIRTEEAKMSGKRFRPAVEPPYRWRDWAAKPEGITGDELIGFVNNEEAVRPDGKKGPGLFAYLRSLHGANGGDRRDVIATVFKGTINRMINGYLLRDVINKVNDIHFTSSDEIHTLGHLYESMLKEMRDAAGDSGEFYTPRPVVRFMVEVIDPKLGEVILDPACGTGGFLVESFKHLETQCKTVEDRKILQTQSIFGGEAKPLPYLLAQMNLVLHGLESPKIDPLNSLRFPLREIGDKERVDIIMTNPPFGGEEERGILGNFPEDKQTSETALLFLQLIMRKLRRPGSPSGRGKGEGNISGGRAAVVVPNGTLFGDGVCARIKEELLKDFNLHTIVRLPNGVFAPYTSIPTNLMFFDRSHPTEEVWYYEHPLPNGRKNYTKTQPIQFEEFAGCLTWWQSRQENDRAWKISASELLAAGCNLDRKNPNAASDFEHLPPEQLADDILKKEQRIMQIMADIKRALGEPLP